MVNMLASGRVTMERLAAITFTEAAAAELRDRVRALLLGISQDTLRTVAALLEDRHDLLAPDTVWEAVEPPPALYVAQFVGRRLTQLERSVPYALDGEGDPLIQTVLSAQSNARELLAAHTDDDALSALVGLGFGFGFGKLRADMVSSERWRRSSDSAADGARSLRAASYRDICILLPARTHLRRWSGRSSEWVCHTQSKPASVLATQEVRDLLACLRAIEDSSDQVALVAALRSPVKRVLGRGPAALGGERRAAGPQTPRRRTRRIGQGCAGEPGGVPPGALAAVAGGADRGLHRGPHAGGVRVW